MAEPKRNDCLSTVEKLYERYKDNEYMLQRIYNHIVNYLPTTLENEFKNHEKRINRTNFLTNEKNIFIQVFLSKNKYFYLPTNNFFYEYDGKKIIPYVDKLLGPKISFTDEYSSPRSVKWFRPVAAMQYASELFN